MSNAPTKRSHGEGTKRCRWVQGDALLERYHDREWGIPVRTGRAHFERLSLEVFQAGLSWRLILHKRTALRRCFHRFDPVEVARYGARDVGRLMQEKSIIRNRLKIEATIRNAQRFIEICREHRSFNRYLNACGKTSHGLMSRLQQDFAFVGPRVSQAYLQSVGQITAPHECGCFMHPESRVREDS